MVSSINRIINPNTFKSIKNNNLKIVKKALEDNPENALQNNLRIAKSVLKEFNQEYGKVNSSTRLEIQIEENKGKISSAELEKLKELKKDCESKIAKYREHLNDNLGQDCYMKRLKKFVKETNAMNCGDYAVMLQDHFFKKHNLKTDNVSLLVLEKKNGRIEFSLDKNHTIPVIGIDKKAKLEDPATWGPNAVIVDAWSNVVMKAKDGIEYFKQVLKFNPNDEQLVFRNDNKFWYKA